MPATPAVQFTAAIPPPVSFRTAVLHGNNQNKAQVLFNKERFAVAKPTDNIDMLLLDKIRASNRTEPKKEKKNKKNKRKFKHHDHDNRGSESDPESVSEERKKKKKKKKKKKHHKDSSESESDTKSKKSEKSKKSKKKKSKHRSSDSSDEVCEIPDPAKTRYRPGSSQGDTKNAIGSKRLPSPSRSGLPKRAKASDFM